MIQPEMKPIARINSLWSFSQKLNFILGYKISCKHYPKSNHMKGKISTCVNKNDWLLLNGPLILDHHRNKIYFILPSIKSNVNRKYYFGHTAS